jgi:uncharacterized lipoprotein YmbA
MILKPTSSVMFRTAAHARAAHARAAHARAALALGTALALGACHSEPTRIYTLDVIPAARLDGYRAPPLRVDTLSVPAGWDRIEILRPSSEGTLDISDFDHWSAQLAQAARQTLSADLSARLPPGSVIYPRLPKSGGALGVSVDMLQFKVDGSRASLQASWIITPATGTPAPASQGTRRSEAVLQDSMTSTQAAAVVHAWSALIGQLADHIAADASSFQSP